MNSRDSLDDFLAAACDAVGEMCAARREAESAVKAAGLGDFGGIPSAELQPEAQLVIAAVGESDAYDEAVERYSAAISAIRGFGKENAPEISGASDRG